MTGSGQSTIRLTTGGWITGQLIDFDDEYLVLNNVTQRVGTRNLVDPTTTDVRVPLAFVVGVDDDD